MRRPVAAAVALLAVASITLAGFAGYRLGYAKAMTGLMSDAGHRLDLFTSTAVLMINRLSSIPATIELNADVVSLVSGGAPSNAESVNRFLHRLSAHLGSEAIFVTDERGLVVGSSNTTRQDDSRLGADIAYRPYYQDALSGFVGRHFSLGEARDAPGYFVAYPIHNGDRVAGVATVKISLNPVVDAFPLLGKPALIADRDNVVILASQKDWLYTSLTPVSVDQRVDLELTGMYGRNRIGAFPLTVELNTEAASLGLDTVAEEEEHQTDLLNRIEHGLKSPVEVILFLFGLANAGVEFSAIGEATWLVFLGLVIGKPLGITTMGWIAARPLGFGLPVGMRMSDLFVLGCVAAIGFTVSLFVAGVAFPPGQVQDAAKMGALFSFAAAAIAIATGKLLRVKRQALPAAN